MQRVRRSGPYFRAAKPDWADPLDTSFSVAAGGRWNAPGSHAVLYLNRDRITASANARRWFAEQGGFDVLDLQPSARPVLIAVGFEPCDLVDAVTDDGLEALGLPLGYPYNVSHATCQPLGAGLHAAGELGVACRSAAECGGPGLYVGEEAALFEGRVTVTREESIPFGEWYSPV